MLISRALVQGGVLNIKSPKQLQMVQRHITLSKSPRDVMNVENNENKVI
jgi:hypothetical protein